MKNVSTRVSVAQLKSALQLREQIDSLQVELGKILSAPTNTGNTPRRGRPPKVPTFSSARGMKPKRKMSVSARAKIAAAAKKRWAKAKANGQRTLKDS